MRVLLDTHAFIWWVAGDARLSAEARAIFEDPNNIILVSAAVGWEIAIKEGTGKLGLPEPPSTYMASRLALNRFEELPITMAHALRTYSLPLHHRDPFDRILVAQSQVEASPIVTDDATITKYGVQTIW